MLLLIAVSTDIRTGRISNRLVCFGLGTGLIFQIWESGSRGMFVFLIQVIFPVIILFLLFLMRALGAGDIKLFSVIGGIWNFKVLAYCMFFAFLTGAVFSFFKLVYQKNLFLSLKHFFQYVQVSLQEGKIMEYERRCDGKQNIICFSIAIFIGFCISMLVPESKISFITVHL